MINLLPLEEKRHIKGLYRSRMAVVSLAALSALFVFGMAGLLPSYLNALGKNDSFTAESDEKGGDSAGERKELLEETREINRKIEVLLRTKNTAPPTELILSVLKEQSPSIRVVDISYTSPVPAVGNTKPKSAVLTFSGVAETRDALLSFVNALNTLGLFSSVDLPISNFVKDRNLSFSVNIEAKEKGKEKSQ